MGDSEQGVFKFPFVAGDDDLDAWFFAEKDGSSEIEIAEKKSIAQAVDCDVLPVPVSTAQSLRLQFLRVGCAAAAFGALA